MLRLASLAFLIGFSSASDTSVEVLKHATFTEVTKEGFWFLEFYAPWCGHCKKLNPILDEIAPEALAKSGMHIGKVDTTVDKKLAEQFKVNSYPTLKFRVSGAEEWKEYNGGRKGPDLLAFAERMAGAPLPELNNEADLKAIVNRSSVAGSGVAFVFGGGDGDNFLGAGGVAETAAKAVQHKSYCGAVNSGNGLPWNGAANALPSTGSAYVAAVEQGEAPRFCPETATSDGKTLEKWIEAFDAPLLSQLGPMNFRHLGRLGKMLVIAIADPSNATTPAYLDSVRNVARGLLAEKQQVATASGDTVSLSEQFVFGYLDGVKFADFIEQYNIFKGELPRLVVVDAPKEMFFEDREVDEVDEMATFLREVASGKVPAQKENTGGMMGAAWRFYYKVRSLGWRAGILVVPMLLLVVVACIAKPEDEDPFNAKYKPTKEQVDRLRPKND